MNTQTQTRIDFGAVGWRLPDVGITFGTRERANEYAKEHAIVGYAGHIDSRPTLRDVAKAIAKAENEHLGLESKWTVGPWDEYFHVSGHESDAKWPADYRWIAVFVVVGGSEGLYLHVEAIDSEGKRTLLILGKTCAGGREAWDRCYESAGRISWLLNS